MASRNPDQPNLLFVLTDDQGAWAMGCAGNGEVRSPNLDRLAREGIRFDNFFCTSPVCSPARASILTGRIPSQHGVHDALMWQSDTSKGGLDREVPADRVQFLLGMPTYAELLRDRGYDTCLSGKWHLGDGLEPRCGFDTCSVSAATRTAFGPCAGNWTTGSPVTWTPRSMDPDSPLPVAVSLIMRRGRVLSPIGFPGSISPTGNRRVPAQ